MCIAQRFFTTARGILFKGAFMALGGLESRFLRLGQIAASACIAFCAIAPTASSAQAHGWRHQHRHVYYAARYHRYARREAAPAYGPPFSALVIDANTNRTLYSVNENELRHPASITKVMTLYLLFEQLDKGALTMQSQLPVSAHAAAQEPSKLGLEPGQTISVENAIKAVVTRSANDAAVVIAEAIGGSESAFCQQMTRKAHEIGMSRTQYVDATGLPNDGQITTAHDLAILGRAVETRFPRYFKFFSTHEFEYAGEIISSHNHLLGRVDGVDGIKTGYVRASGFNLLTSVHRDGRSLIAVVIGGRSAASRDAMMESLIADHLAEASVGRPATMVADVESPPEPPRAGRSATMAAAAETQEPPSAPVLPAAEPPARPAPLTVADTIPAPPARSTAEPMGEGDADDSDDDDAPRVAAVLPPAKLAQRLAVTPHAAPAMAIEPPARPAPAPIVHMAAATPEALGWVKGPDGAPVADKPALAAKTAAAAPAIPPRAKEETQIARSDQGGRNDQVARADDARVNPRDAWIIQIGATSDAAQANDLLNRAMLKDKSALASAKPLTEKIKRGDDIFYRARFAGLDSASAELACRSLKRSGFSCFATRD